jgi:long-subunit acyl-CoA synthetase (AMP-forming)
LKIAVEIKLAAEPDTAKRVAVQSALDASIRKVKLRMAAEDVPADVDEAARLAEPIFAALREQFGLDRADVLLSGGAPIAEEVLQFFMAMGLPILECWGMSESCATVTSNHRTGIRIGTVGQVLPGIELRLDDDGEMLVRGPTVMRGYRNDSEKTAEAIDSDGWLHTGDIGAIDEDGYVRIVDRKKELIINSAGKNMSPTNIENKLKAASSLIGSAVAIGDRRPYNTALIVLDPEAAAEFARQRDLPDPSVASVAKDALLQAEVSAAADRANAELSRVEQIKRFIILPVEWYPDSDELTATMKLKRRQIAAKYAAEIEGMYA